MLSDFNLSIPAKWEKLDSVRDKAEAFLYKNEFNKEQVYAMVMTTSELAENAIKYGDSDCTDACVQISLSVRTKEVIIEVKNKIKDINDSDLKKLDEDIQWIRGFQSHYEAYLEKIKHVSGKSLEDGESGLGLVRIAYEGQCILDFYINENDILAMSAVYKL